MKKAHILFLSLLLGWVAGCKPEEFDSVGKPFNRVEQLQGTWKMARVIQVDADGEYRGYPESVLRQDITNMIEGVNYTDFEIAFTVGADGKPATFSVTRGSAPVDVPDSGNWGFNDPEFPSVVTLGSGDAARNFDIASLANLPAGTITLNEVKKFVLANGSEGRDFVRYEYVLVKK